MRELAATVDPKRIQLSAAASVVGGLAMIIGTFLPFNNSSVNGLLTISRTAYQLGPLLSDNGIGIYDSIFGLAPVSILGISIFCGYRGYWFDPMKHLLFAMASGIVIFNQMNANKTTLSGVVYHSLAVVGTSASSEPHCASWLLFVRFPSKDGHSQCFVDFVVIGQISHR